MKFDLPPIVFSEQEMTIWNNLPNEMEDQAFLKLTEDLFNLREQGTKVSCLTNELVSMEDVNEQRNFVQSKKDCQLIHENFITSLASLNKSVDEDKALQMLVIGTEESQLLFFHPVKEEILYQITLNSVPCQILAEGQYDVEYRLFVSCRNGCIYQVKSGVILE